METTGTVLAMPHHANSGSFQRGHIAWNKGMLGYNKSRKHSKATKALMSILAKERCRNGTMPRSPRVRMPTTCEICNTEYYVIPSRLSKTRYCSSDCCSVAKSKRTPWNKGMFNSTSYGGYHNKVRRTRGTPSFCEVCSTTTAKKFEWANLTGNYEDVNDYKRMCTSCHSKHDGKIRNITGIVKEDDIKKIDGKTYSMKTNDDGSILLTPQSS